MDASARDCIRTRDVRRTLWRWRRHAAWRWRLREDTRARHEMFKERLLQADEAAIEALPRLVTEDGKVNLEYLDRRRILKRRPTTVKGEVRATRLHVIPEAEAAKLTSEELRAFLANRCDRQPQGGIPRDKA